MLDKKLKLSLLLLRIGVFIVMGIWTIDKFIRPAHTSAVFKKFYLISDLSVNMSYIVGSIQLFVVFAFLLGFKKRISYGLVLILHTISTLSSFQQYLNPWEGGNILFFAAWPMLSAIIMLYLLRDQDTLFTLNKG
ncbi:hypothetical protein [Halobacteriovorax sp.]|uniref:hypothetical protein n=1 Tax=Halobacteriovorax sp. TaxID=2020862 RepID=UPI003AF23F6E